MKKILAIVGDFYHPADYLIEGLKNCLKENFLLNVKENYRNISWSKLQEYDVFILAGSVKVNPKENDEIWLTDKHQEQIHNYVLKGGKLFVLHSGLSGYPKDGLLRRLIKGHFIEHPVEHPKIEIESTNNKSVYNLAQGIENFTIIDEQYFVDVDVDETEIFLKAESKEYGSSIAGWAHNYGEGKVYCLTPGHSLEVLSDKMIKKLIFNGVNW